MRLIAARQFFFCRLQVAGCGFKFNYNWETAGTKRKHTSGRLTVTVTWRCLRSLSKMASTEAMGEYIPMILSLQLLVLKKTSEISSEIAAEFGVFPVSTKLKAE